MWSQMHLGGRFEYKRAGHQALGLEMHRPRPAPAGPTIQIVTSPPEPPRLAGLADAVALVGDRWTLLIIAALLEGPRRFGDLEAEVDGIAPNVLTQRLRALTRDGLVVASAYSERPPRFVYELNANGRELAPALRLLAGWGAAHATDAEPPRHDACGTPLELQWWCPECQQIVTGPEQETGDDEEWHFA
jgi:DNA-binding HxlR family transcriptional regulator